MRVLSCCTFTQLIVADRDYVLRVCTQAFLLLLYQLNALPSVVLLLNITYLVLTMYPVSRPQYRPVLCLTAG